MFLFNHNDYITKNYQWKEFCVSREPSKYVPELWGTIGGYVENLYLLCHVLLQPLRDEIKMPLIVTSGYRDPVLNNKTKGASRDSSHLYCMAADITIADKTKRWRLYELYKFAKKELKNNIGELILYVDYEGTPTHLHVALPRYQKEQKIDKVINHGNNTHPA
jgi:hypothetical protein